MRLSRLLFVFLLFVILFYSVLGPNPTDPFLDVFSKHGGRLVGTPSEIGWPVTWAYGLKDEGSVIFPSQILQWSIIKLVFNLLLGSAFFGMAWHVIIHFFGHEFQFSIRLLFSIQLIGITYVLQSRGIWSSQLTAGTNAVNITFDLARRIMWICIYLSCLLFLVSFPGRSKLE